MFSRNDWVSDGSPERCYRGLMAEMDFTPRTVGDPDSRTPIIGMTVFVWEWKFFGRFN